jgi:hypothetical protein
MKKLPVILDIGGVRAGFSGGGNFSAELRRRYARFVVRGRSDFLFELGSREKRRFPDKPVILQKAGFTRFTRGDFDCLMEERTRRGRLNFYPAAQTFDSFLRTFYSWLLLREGGMLLHCAGLVKNGRAYLFPGRSGAGKSTLSKLAAEEGAEIISDELNLVRPEKNGFNVYGSPFWGEMRNEGRRGVWPLEKIFALRKSARHRIADAAPGYAMAVLLRGVMNFSKTPDSAAASLKNAANLLASVPFRRLEFSRQDAGFLELVTK